MGRLADAFRQLNVPVIVVACKTDLEAAVSLSDVEAVVRRYDAGIIQTSIVEESGKCKAMKLERHTGCDRACDRAWYHHVMCRAQYHVIIPALENALRLLSVTVTVRLLWIQCGYFGAQFRIESNPTC